MTTNKVLKLNKMTTEPDKTEPGLRSKEPASAESPVEEMIPLVKPEGSPSTDEGSAGESKGEVEERPPTPQEMDCYECRSCGYTYEPTKGDNRTEVPVGVPFKELTQSWRCPVCGSSKKQFSNVGPIGTASGFKENLSYGFGVNTLTPAQKNLLIFGALGIAVLFFLSLYGLR